jgi:hypothetical protein
MIGVACMSLSDSPIFSVVALNSLEMIRSKVRFGRIPPNWLSEDKYDGCRMDLVREPERSRR